jgi:protein-tyrosine-phosphatase
MKILFVCKYNRFRSKIAEALLRLYCKDRNLKIESAGIERDFMHPNVPESVNQVVAEMGAKVVSQDSQQVEPTLTDWADKIVIVADDVSNDDFPEEKVERWEVKDGNEYDIESIRRGARKIDKKVKDLVKRLNE